MPATYTVPALTQAIFERNLVSTEGTMGPVKSTICNGVKGSAGGKGRAIGQREEKIRRDRLKPAFTKPGSVSPTDELLEIRRNTRKVTPRSMMVPCDGKSHGGVLIGPYDYDAWLAWSQTSAS